MKTLPAAVTAAYLKQGVRPRLYLQIADSGKYWATAAVGDYTNRLGKKGGSGMPTVRSEVEPGGGMGTVSGCDLSVLRLGETMVWHQAASISPLKEAPILGAGRLMSSGSIGEAYSDVRGAGSASLSNVGLLVGQRYSPGSDVYTVYRGPLQFSVPAGLTSCEEAYLKLSGYSNKALTAFDVALYEGEWSALAGGIFDEFDGCVNPGAYTGSQLNESFASADFTEGGEIYIRLNRDGRQAVVDHAGGTLRMMMLSSRDVAATAPTGDEYLWFEVSDAQNTPTLELIYNTVEPDNRRASVMLGYETDAGVAPSSGDDMITVWTGVVDDIDMDDELLNLKMLHENFRRNVWVPGNIITRNNFPDCPDENIGQVYGFLIGDFDTDEPLHRNGVGYYQVTVGAATISYGYRDYFKMPVVTKMAPYEFIVSELSALISSEQIYYPNNTRNVFELIPAELSDTSTASRTSMEFENDGSAHGPHNSDGLYVSAAVLPVSTEINGTVSNIENSYNEEIDDYAETQTGLNTRIDYYFRQPDGLMLGDALTAVVTIEGILGVVDDQFSMTVEYTDDEGATWSAAATKVWLNDDGRVDINVDLKDFAVFAGFRLSSLDQLRIRFNMEAYTAGRYRLKNVCILCAHAVEQLTELGAYGYGLSFGEWIDNAGRSNPYSFGNTVECPPMVIEALVREYTDMGDSDIDTAAFDAAASQLSGWKLAFRHDGPREPLFNDGGRSGVVNRIAEQSRSSVFWTSDGTLSIAVLNTTDGFAHSGTDVPGELDIFTTERGLVTAGSYTRMPITEWRGLRLTDMDDVKNDFVLKYRKNYATGEYMEALYMTNGGGVAGSVDTNITSGYLENGRTLTQLKEFCAASYNRIRTTNTITIEADLIRDEATATRLLQSRIEWLTKRRRIAVFESELMAVVFEAMDFINIRHHDIIALYGTAVCNTKKWAVRQHNPNFQTNSVEIEAVEIDTIEVN